MAELAIKIHNYIGESRFNWDTLEFEWATCANDIRQAIEWAGYDGLVVDSILLEIGTCYGGSLYEGIEIINYLRGLGIPVRTRILAFAASTATIIGFAGDVVEIDQAAQFMVHGPSAEAAGTVADMASGLQMLTNAHATLRDMYVARTGQAVEVVEEWISKDTWLTASQALALGLVTKVIPLAPKTAPVLSDAQAKARRTRFTGIVARADKRMLEARTAPKPKAKTKAAPAAPTPRPMAKKVIPIAKAVAKAGTLTATQKANAQIVANLAKQLGVKAEIEGVEETPTASAEATVLADGAGSLYTDGVLAEGSEVFNDEALTIATDDGVYETEDGRDITVTGGSVESITEVEAEAPAESTAIMALIEKQGKAMEALSAQMERFSKAVPPTPRAKSEGAQGPDAKNTPKPKTKGVLAGASTTK